MPDTTSGQSPWRRYLRTVQVPAPAAGADWSLAVPAGSVYGLISVQASLTTSATVADRAPRLQLTDGDAIYLDLPPQAVQAASLTGRFAWVQGMSTYGSAGGQVVGMPALLLQPGWTLGTSTDNIDTTDQWSAVELLILETVVRAGPIDIGAVPQLLVEVTNPANG